MSRLGRVAAGSIGGAGVGVGAAGTGKRRRWYLGIQSKKEAAHVMTEVIYVDWLVKC